MRGFNVHRQVADNEEDEQPIQSRYESDEQQDNDYQRSDEEPDEPVNARKPQQKAYQAPEEVDSGDDERAGSRSARPTDTQPVGEDDRQTESDGEEYEAAPPSPGQLSRTQSDPTPMPTEEERDHVSTFGGRKVTHRKLSLV